MDELVRDLEPFDEGLERVEQETNDAYDETREIAGTTVAPFRYIKCMKLATDDHDDRLPEGVVELDRLIQNYIDPIVDREDFSGFDDFEQGGERLFIGVPSVHTVGLYGMDAWRGRLPPAPDPQGDRMAAEMIDAYGMEQLRDVPFVEWPNEPGGDGSGGIPSDTLTALRTDITRIESTVGEWWHDGSRLFVEADTDTVDWGPYLSQFLVQDVQLWALNAAQQYLRYPEEDYNDTTEKWLDTIEGKGPYAAETNPRKPDREKQGYIATPRHLATIVNAEPPFQEYLIATIQLLGNTDFDENLPFTSRDHGRVFDYTDTGPVGLLDMITRAGRQALLAAFFQKWRVHLRCRPETYSGRIYGSYKAKTSPFRAGIQPTNPLLTMFNTLPDIPRPVVTFTTLIVISAYEHSSMLETTRTYRAKLVNYQQVSDDLDDCGHSASKLWNVARYYSQQEWDDNGEIPSEADLKRELKDHERYSDLHSQSSQRVLEELAESFSGWLKKRKNGDTDVNPPGYRKRGDTHPRSTVTWKQNGIKHDSKHNQLRLSKGFNLKTHRSDFILAEYETRPDVTVENIQQVRAVWNGDRWELHLVCKVEIPVEDAPGDNTAGIDLGISNYLAIAYDDGDAELYPGNVLKQDKHYFTRDEYDTEGENGPSRRALRARQKLSRRKDHFLHALAKHVVEQCIDHEVGRIAIGELSKMREDENGDSRNWGKRGNKKLHGWEFDRFTRLLEYKAEEHGILVDRTSERDTSKTCSCCGRKRDANRVERGLYVCKSCGATMNADVNGAVNIRRKITQSPPTEDMSNGRLARPVAYLFNQTSGRFAPSERVGCEP